MPGREGSRKTDYPSWGRADLRRPREGREEELNKRQNLPSTHVDESTGGSRSSGQSVKVYVQERSRRNGFQDFCDNRQSGFFDSKTG